MRWHNEKHAIHWFLKLDQRALFQRSIKPNSRGAHGSQKISELPQNVYYGAFQSNETERRGASPFDFGEKKGH